MSILAVSFTSVYLSFEAVRSFFLRNQNDDEWKLEINKSLKYYSVSHTGEQISAFKELDRELSSSDT